MESWTTKVEPERHEKPERPDEPQEEQLPSPPQPPPSPPPLLPPPQPPQPPQPPAAPSATKFQLAAGKLVARSRLRTQLEKFSQETSLPGVSQVGVNSGRGLAWTSLLLLSVVALLVHLCIIVSVYLSYSTTTSSNYDQRFQWPDVTLCNLVPLSVSAVDRQLAAANESELGSFIAALPTVAAQLAANNSPVANTQDLRELMIRSRNLTQVAHRLNDSLLSCNYRGVDCISGGGSIRQTYVPRFHTCYTVSVGDSGGALADDDFLDMMLFVESGVLSYWDRRTLADFSPAGKVFVHARDTYPNVEDILDLPTGAWVMLGLSYTERNNYERRCRSYEGRVQFSPASGEKQFTVLADRRSCLEATIQTELVKQCGCVSEKFRRFNDQTAGQPGCHAVAASGGGGVTSAEKARAACHSGALTGAFEKATAVCQADCQERSWAIRVSPHVWPKLEASVTALLAAYATPAVLERGLDARLLQVNGTNVTDLDAKSRMDFVQRSFLRVTVNPTRTTGLRIDENLVYTLGNLLSDLGGILGLYLGFSVVFLYEIAFLLVQLASSEGAAA